MGQNFRNNGNAVNGLLGRLAAEKKKTFIALGLIVVMGFMWVKVLLRKGPQSAEGAVSQRQVKSGTSESNSELKISFIELPKVKGRNDVLTRDFFASNGWEDFIRDREGTEEVSVVSKDGSEEVMKRVAEKLKLQAISLDVNPQVFINDKLLAVGDKLPISDGVNVYECEVAGIEENRVFIKCGEAEITLKLLQTIEAVE